MPDFGPEVRRILSANGCSFYRKAKGDHELWFSPITDRKVRVDHKIKSHGERRLKQAGIAKAF